MRIRDAKDQVERDHPELRGGAKAEAIRALRDADKAAQPAKASEAEPQPESPAPVGPDEREPSTDQPAAKPSGGWLWVAWLALLAWMYFTKERLDISGLLVVLCWIPAVLIFLGLAARHQRVKGRSEQSQDPTP
jgi:hypothetical protein